MALAVASRSRPSPPAGSRFKLRPRRAEKSRSGYWILRQRARRWTLAAWWSDEELAKIIAGERSRLCASTLKPTGAPKITRSPMPPRPNSWLRSWLHYWGGDVPQANFWAHGALTRRGSTLRAFRWEHDGLTQRSELEDAGLRPKIGRFPGSRSRIARFHRWDNGS